MEVIYDISLLAQAQRHTKARTGVFRVVENVARGLAGSSECKLRFCVAETINHPVNFLTRDPQLGKVDFALSGSARFKLGLYGEIHELTDRLNANPMQGIALPLKASRKVLYLLADFLARHGQLLRNSDLAAANIYHSPFHALPEQTLAANGLKRFLTVYDLIPILCPKLFEPDLKALLPQILGSLRPRDFAFCISESTKNDLCNYRSDLDPERVFVTPLAASELFFPCRDSAKLSSIRRKYRIAEGDPYFLSLSTLEPRKNLEQVIKSFSRLVREQRIDDLRLVLVGVKGWNYGNILKAIKEFELSEDRIILTGYVADEDLAGLYSGALGFVYLSLYEGFGLPPLEAMQCGVPVITSNRASLPEVVGNAGFMFDPYDEDGICQAMSDLYWDERLRLAMSRSSLERAKEFSWDRCVRMTVGAYRKALE